MYLGWLGRILGAVGFLSNGIHTDYHCGIVVCHGGMGDGEDQMGKSMQPVDVYIHHRMY